MPDTMKIADELSAAGMENRQAWVIARALSDTEYATKGDVALLTGQLNVLTGRTDAMDKWLKFGVGLLAAVFLKIFLG